MIFIETLQALWVIALLCVVPAALAGDTAPSSPPSVPQGAPSAPPTGMGNYNVQSKTLPDSNGVVIQGLQPADPGAGGRGSLSPDAGSQTGLGVSIPLFSRPKPAKPADVPSEEEDEPTGE